VGEILPSTSGVSFSKEARDVLIECCVEFITLISSEANEISEKEAKKTIACDHITRALDTLGFSEYVAAVLEAAQEHKEGQKVSIPLPTRYYMQTLTHLTEPREESQQVSGERVEHRGTGQATGGAVCCCCQPAQGLGATAGAGVVCLLLRVHGELAFALAFMRHGWDGSFRGCRIAHC
jgi:histone H3/H4